MQRDGHGDTVERSLPSRHLESAPQLAELVALLLPRSRSGFEHNNADGVTLEQTQQMRSSTGATFGLGSSCPLRRSRSAIECEIGVASCSQRSHQCSVRSARLRLCIAAERGDREQIRRPPLARSRVVARPSGAKYSGILIAFAGLLLTVSGFIAVGTSDIGALITTGVGGIAFVFLGAPHIISRVFCSEAGIRYRRLFFFINDPASSIQAIKRLDLNGWLYNFPAIVIET